MTEPSEQDGLPDGVAPLSSGLLLLAWPLLLVIVALGLASVEGSWLTLASVLLMWTLCCFSIGALVGFVFGIPRFREAGADEDASDAGARTERRRSYAPNTNLEQISDWLVKILVGVTLVESEKIVSGAAHVTRQVGESLLNSHQALGAVVAGALLVSFFITGFFFAYLSARIDLPRILDKAEEREREAKKILDELDVPTEERPKALEQVQANLRSRSELQRVESQLVALLYVPDGFRRAIDIGEQYLSRSEALSSGLVHRWLACAYGQAHAARAAEPNRSNDEIQRLRGKVLEHAAAAIKLDPPSRQILLNAYQGLGDDDDLTSLRPDADLEGLLKPGATT
jgi:hypothetical protein